MDDRLKSIVERLERLEEEKKSTAADIRDVYAEAKSDGYDVKALRKVVRLRAKRPDERFHEETMVQTYMNALGMT